jgi:hypothetical protein
MLKHRNLLIYCKGRGHSATILVTMSNVSSLSLFELCNDFDSYILVLTDWISGMMQKRSMRKSSLLWWGFKFHFAR